MVINPQRKFFNGRRINKNMYTSHKSFITGSRLAHLTKICCLLLLLLSLKSWCSILPYRFPARFPMIIFLLVLQEPELPAHDRAGERARQVLWHGRLGALQPHPQEISAYRLVYLYWAHLSTYIQINKLRNWIYQKPLISHHSKKYREYE